MKARRLLLAMLGAITFLCACERSTSVGAAGRPAETDAALDADASPDASPGDAATDAGSGDASPDASPGDASTDVSLGEKCLTTGGTVQTGICCASVSDFPEMCSGVIGRCGCGPTASHMISLCECPSNQCFDAAQGCVTQ